MGFEKAKKERLKPTINEVIMIISHSEKSERVI
jgi:hypothetical protein